MNFCYAILCFIYPPKREKKDGYLFNSKTKKYLTVRATVNVFFNSVCNFCKISWSNEVV